MPDGPHILWLREGEEVGAHRLHVGDVVGHVLAAVDDRDRPGGMGRVGEQADRGDGAEHVRHRGERERLGPVEQPVEIGQVELAVGGERNPAQLDAALGGEHVPGHDVGVVLHVGEHARRRRPAGSPGPTTAATRLSASVAFLVNTSSSDFGALMNPRTLFRAPS